VTSRTKALTTSKSTTANVITRDLLFFSERLVVSQLQDCGLDSRIFGMKALCLKLPTHILAFNQWHNFSLGFWFGL